MKNLSIIEHLRLRRIRRLVRDDVIGGELDGEITQQEYNWLAFLRWRIRNGLDDDRNSDARAVDRGRGSCPDGGLHHRDEREAQRARCGWSGSGMNRHSSGHLSVTSRMMAGHYGLDLPTEFEAIAGFVLFLLTGVAIRSKVTPVRALPEG